MVKAGSLPIFLEFGNVFLKHPILILILLDLPAINKKLLVTKGIATRSKKLLVAPVITSSNKKLLLCP